MTEQFNIGVAKRVPAIVFLVAATIVGGGAAVFAQSANLVFVIDASGSMDSRISPGDRPKIEMVRSALAEAVGYMPADRRVGVVALGHRNRGDCEDVEELVPLVPLVGNREFIVGNIGEITPVGMTPLGQALLRAGDMLNSKDGPGAAVLIADGQDSCLGKPCELARKLRGKNPKLVVHVIGLHVTKGAESRLSCIAEAGGGEFLQVRNTYELKSAIQKTMKFAGTDRKDKMADNADDETSTNNAETLPQEDAITDLLEIGEPAEAAPPKAEAGKTAGSLVTTAGVGRIRESPSLESPIVFRVMNGDIVTALEKKGKWFRIDLEGKTGWGHESLFIGLSVKNIATVEKISVHAGREEEKVIFELNRARLPKVSFLKSDASKVACDFPDTAPAAGIGKAAEFDGNLIRGISTDVLEKNGFRVVLDLVPGGDYELAHIFTKNETRYMLIVTNRAQNSDGADG